MAAPESTKFQVNFKTPDGTLINLYATSKEELESLLTAASDFSALIVSTSQAYGSAAPAAPVYASAPAVASAPSAGGEEVVTDKYGNTWVYNKPGAPSCERGVMVLKYGKAQATGKPYKAFYDPAAAPNWTGPKIPAELRTKPIFA